MALIKFRFGIVIFIVFVAIGIGIVSADSQIVPASMEQGPFIGVPADD